MAAAAARSVLRSSPLRNAAARFTSEARSAARPPFRLPKRTPSQPRIFRSPVEMSCCVDSLMPLHSVTASALMTSMLSVSRRGHGWFSEGDETR
ncbi:hypothetical protein QJS04_geneDACA022468 [Acorus gramineus]|uniref:Protein NUCLEAR FUSION DEFECTIVE 6, chloroplastic/mitochondrial-like n=1 Tax=Acorus gramineus TaxID=55184 RepID=A0AAV9BHY7_ACOGR|nr:hypothetical protein QJS04_geneDACA022468 [Acorus gramineus]